MLPHKHMNAIKCMQICAFENKLENIYQDGKDNKYFLFPKSRINFSSFVLTGFKRLGIEWNLNLSDWKSRGEEVRMQKSSVRLHSLFSPII